MLLNNILIERILKSNSLEFENITNRFFNQKKAEHKKLGNSYSIIDSISFFLISIQNHVFFYNSFSIANLYKFKSQLLLEHASSKNDIENSLLNINSCIDILSNINLVNKGIDTLISSHLIRAVLFKILGDKDEALYSINNSKKDLIKFEKEGHSLIKLRRQEQIMFQTKLSHKYLLNEAIKIRKESPIEFYSSYKRLFEFYLNNKMYDQGINAYNTFLISFTNINSELPVISKISFMKNIGQYNIAIGNEKEALKILTIALKKALDLKLTGQIIQIENLLKSIKSMNEIKLLTYRLK